MGIKLFRRKRMETESTNSNEYDFSVFKTEPANLVVMQSASSLLVTKVKIELSRNTLWALHILKHPSHWQAQCRIYCEPYPGTISYVPVQLYFFARAYHLSDPGKWR